MNLTKHQLYKQQLKPTYPVCEQTTVAYNVDFINIQMKSAYLPVEGSILKTKNKNMILVTLKLCVKVYSTKSHGFVIFQNNILKQWKITAKIFTYFPYQKLWGELPLNFQYSFLIKNVLPKNKGKLKRVFCYYKLNISEGWGFFLQWGEIQNNFLKKSKQTFFFFDGKNENV